MNKSRLEQIEAMLLKEPKDPFLNYALAMENSKIGRDDKTLELYEQLIIDHPNYIGTYYHLGKLLEKFGNSEKAEKIYTLGIEKAKANKEFHALSELQSALNLLLYGDD